MKMDEIKESTLLLSHADNCSRSRVDDRNRHVRYAVNSISVAPERRETFQV